MLLNVLISVDQFLNTLTWSKRDGWGKPDETLSARGWRLRDTSTAWHRFRKVVDFLFFWDKDHCFSSYKSEVLARQLPDEYYEDAIELFRLAAMDSSIDVDAALRKIS